MYRIIDGGGVFCTSSSPTLNLCTISGNSAVYRNIATGGGGLRCEGASPVVTNCRITGNEAGTGAGVECWNRSCPTLTNCSITANSSWDCGGVDCTFDSAPVVAQNYSLYGEGAIVCSAPGNARLVNCILWGNAPGDGACGERSHTLAGEDPLFVRAGVFDFGLYRCRPFQEACWPAFLLDPPDYHLQSGSPAIDEGTLAGAPIADMEGRGRPCGAGIDIGAYEIGDCPPPPCGDPEADDDDDGVKNGAEDVNQDGNCTDDDSDGDGIPNFRDPDDDGDGIPTRDEDYNGNGDPRDDDLDVDTVPGYLDADEKPAPIVFARGDANADGRVDIGDAISVLGYLFGAAGGGAKAQVAQCLDAADANDDARLDIADAIKILGHLFARAGPLPEPFGRCGVDPTEDGLDCLQFMPCE